MRTKGETNMRSKAIIDTKLYSVVTDTGFNRGSLTHEEALAMAARMREQARQAGWGIKIRVIYRDGSEVKE
jgi:hypothetical protein